MVTLGRAIWLAASWLAVSLVLGTSASAQNNVFPSTSAESSDAWYFVQFRAAVGGVVDKIRVTFPVGAVGGTVGLGDVVIGGVSQRATVSIVGGNPDRIVVDLNTSRTVTAGTDISLEVAGLTNPVSGNYNVVVQLLDSASTVLETLPPIPLAIAPGSTGDITGVAAGFGLTGGGTSGEVDLAVDPAEIQRRVAGRCAVGSAMRLIRQDGTVGCEIAGGTVASIATGDGLTGGPITTTGTISVAPGGITTSLLGVGAVTGAKLAESSVDSTKIVDGSIGSADVNTAQIQARVTGTCTAGNAIRAISSIGGVTCEATGGGGGGFTDDGAVVRLTTPTDSVGIGTAVPASKLHVASPAAGLPPRLQSAGTNGFAAGWDFYHGATGRGYVGVPDASAGFAPNEMLVFGGTGIKTSIWAGQTRGLTADTTGNIGIGTTTPSSRVEVVGQDGLKIRGFQPFLTLQDDNAASKQGFVQSVDGGVAMLTNSRAALIVQDVTGNVGIGTAAPASRLTVEGTADPLLRIDHVGPGGNPALWLQQDGVAKAFMYWNNANGSLGLGTSTTNPVLTLFGDGSVATANTTQIGNHLILVGKLFLGSNAGFNFGNPVGACIDNADSRRPLGFCTSSLRYKHDVEGFTGGLDIVNRLRAIRFTWNGEGGAADIGLAAEEVEQIEPLLAFRNGSGETEGVRYNQLSAVFVNAFKEQQAQIERQGVASEQDQRRIQELQREVHELKARIDEVVQLVRAGSPHRTVSADALSR